MRPVRFVALSEDGHALVLADEMGHLLALPLDERINGALSPDRATQLALATPESPPLLAPRDIQARIRLGETADEVARAAGVPVDRVLRYAGPVLQERAMLAQHARRTRLKVGDAAPTKTTLADVVDARLGQHGVDLEKISWDAYRREDGTWRVVATWPSGKATATAVWELDKARQVVTPHDEMAQYLCTDRSTPAHEVVRGHELKRPEPSRGGHEPMRAPLEPRREPARPNRDPIRAGRDALLASLERPLQPTGGTRSLEPTGPAVTEPRRPAAMQPSAFDDDRDVPQQVPAVPSLAVLRPRRGPSATDQPGDEPTTEKPRKRAPSWDDVLFGGAPTARDA